MSFQLTEETENVRLNGQRICRERIRACCCQKGQGRDLPHGRVKKMGELGLLGMMVAC